jgi:aminoglycoside 3-N-acetyltransferase
MDLQRAVEWITRVFGVDGRILDLADSRMSVPEWDSLGVLILQLRLKEDHGIVLSDEEVSKLETVRDIWQIIESRSTKGFPGVSLQAAVRSDDSHVSRPEKRFNFSNMIQGLWTNLPAKQKSRIRSLRKNLVKAFLSYRQADLIRSLHSLGVQEGDTVLVHSSFKQANGFVGSPEHVIDAFLGAVGSTGNLMMLSLPYLSSTYEYLQSLKCFDVRRTNSQMGLLSEIFRERANVIRSLHPTHPMLVCGPKAEWFVKGHEECPHACGAGTPFEKLAQVGGKVLFFDAPFGTFTFFHYLEDMVRHLLPFPLYHPEAFHVPVIDYEGRRITVSVYAFSPNAIRRRKSAQFEAEVRKARLIVTKRLGNTQLEYVEVKPMIEFVNRMVERGNLFFYDLT